MTYQTDKILDSVRVPDIYEAVVHLGVSLNEWHFFVRALAYLFSIFLLLNMISRLARMGSQGGFTANNRAEGWGGIVTTFLISVALFYLPSTLNSITITVFEGGGSAFAYTPPDYYSSEKLVVALGVIYKFIGICGVCAVIVGLLDWHRVGAGLTRHGWGKGAWHIIGGWAAMHLDDVIQMLKFSAGFGT